MKKLFSILIDKDSNGIHHNIPNARYGKWEINSLGFRGKEIDFEKKEGNIRIVCLGGSETLGYYESKDKEWPSQLGEMLRDRFPKVEVINASAAGLNFKMKIDYMKKYVLPLKPDIAIIFGQRFLPYVKESIRRGKGNHLTSEAKGKKVNKPNNVFISCGRVLSKLGESIEGCLPKQLLTHISIWRLRRRIRRKENKHLINKEPMDELPGNFLLEFETDLRSFINYQEENHIVPVLSTFPSLITPFNKDIYKSLLLATRLVFGVEFSENGIIHHLEKMNQIIMRIAEQENLVFIDIDNLIPKTLEYFGDNFHYTNKGSEIIAKNIYDILTRYELIK